MGDVEGVQAGGIREGLMHPYNKNLVELAKDLRKNMTPAEKCLWKRIRLKSLGCTFFRQRPIGEYIVDFYCPKADLVIEVDGDIHLGKEAIENDYVRDEYMGSLELVVLRFLNLEVLNNTDKVVEKIRNQIRLNPPPYQVRGRLLKGRTNH
jgi:very-short-patch-repair endonuclease